MDVNLTHDNLLSVLEILLSRGEISGLLNLQVLVFDMRLPSHQLPGLLLTIFDKIPQINSISLDCAHLERAKNLNLLSWCKLLKRLRGGGSRTKRAAVRELTLKNLNSTFSKSTLAEFCQLAISRLNISNNCNNFTSFFGFLYRSLNPDLNQGLYTVKKLTGKFPVNLEFLFETPPWVPFQEVVSCATKRLSQSLPNLQKVDLTFYCITGVNISFELLILLADLLTTVFRQRRCYGRMLFLTGKSDKCRYDTEQLERLLPNTVCLKQAVLRKRLPKLIQFHLGRAEPASGDTLTLRCNDNF